MMLLVAAHKQCKLAQTWLQLHSDGRRGRGPLATVGVGQLRQLHLGRRAPRRLLLPPRRWRGRPAQLRRGRRRRRRRRGGRRHRGHIGRRGRSPLWGSRRLWLARHLQLRFPGQRPGRGRPCPRRCSSGRHHDCRVPSELVFRGCGRVAHVGKGWGQPGRRLGRIQALLQRPTPGSQGRTGVRVSKSQLPRSWGGQVMLGIRVSGWECCIVLQAGLFGGPLPRDAMPSLLAQNACTHTPMTSNPPIRGLARLLHFACVAHWGMQPLCTLLAVLAHDGGGGGGGPPSAAPRGADSRG
jgi:hypothetical protein